jgi:hypothetical protein
VISQPLRRALESRIPSSCELLAATDPRRYERAALRWLQRFIAERLPPLSEVALAASALAELRHGQRAVGVGALKRFGPPDDDGGLPRGADLSGL